VVILRAGGVHHLYASNASASATSRPASALSGAWVAGVCVRERELGFGGNINASA
jgi:hypothetical protein